MEKRAEKARLKWYTGRILILVVMLLIVGLVGFGCIEGMREIGWSGGAVADNALYVGTEEGRLVMVDLTNESRQWAEALKATSSSSLFGCMPMGGGCSGAASGVAIYGMPTISNELVYIAGYNGKVYAYVKETLVTRWIYPREGYLEPVVGGVAVADGKVFVGDSDGMVYALDAETGDYLWEFSAGDEKGDREKIWSTLAVSEGTLYFGSFNKKVYAINTADGSKKWEYLTEGAVTAEPLVVDGTVYVGSHDRYFYALNAADGSLKWKFMGGNWFWAKPVIYEGSMYAGCLDGWVYVLDAATGAEVKRYNLEGHLAASPVIHEDNVIFSTRVGTLYSINVTRDEVKHLAVINEGDVKVYGPLAINDGIIYIHTQDLTLRRVNAENGAILGSISLSLGE
jgi:glucose dehydrogenase